MEERAAWLYDETRQIGTDYESRDEVERYDERMSRLRDFDAELDEIAEMTGLAAGQTLIEYGCGTGRIAREAARRCGRVIAIDISPAMLARAEDRARAEGIDNMTFVQSGFLNYSHEGPPADVALSQLALHHLPDFWKLVALKNICGALREGGKLFLKDVVFSLDVDRYASTIDYTIRHVAETAGEEMARGYRDHIQKEFSTYDWIMEEMLYRAGFTIEYADYRDDLIAVYLCSRPRAGAR